jgi:integrase
VEKVPFIRDDKEKSGRTRILTLNEEAKLLNVLSTSSIKWANDVADLVQLLLCTGMRVSEGLALEPRDADLDGKRVHIWKNKDNRPRTVPITGAVVRMLQFRNAQAIGTPPYFNGLTLAACDRVWAWARGKMGLSKDKQFVLHALRHTCASRLLASGIDLYILSKFLGHASIVETERYAHLAPDAMQRVEDVLESQNSNISMAHLCRE